MNQKKKKASKKNGTTATQPPALDEVINQAATLFREQKFKQCVGLLERNHSVVTNNQRLLGLLASCYKTIGEPKKAETYFKASLALDPSQADILHNYAGLLSDNGETEKAVKYSRSCISFSNEINHLVRAASIQAEHGDLERGVKIAQKALNLYPDNVKAWICYAEIQETIGAEQEFKKAIAQALEVNPKDLIALGHQANIDLKRGEVNKAKTSLQTVIETPEIKNKTKSQSLIVLGKCHEAEGDLDLAITCFRESINIFPNNPGAYSCLSKHIKDKVQAQKLVDQIKANCTAKPGQEMSSLAFALANLFYATGNLDSSSNYLGKANSEKLKYYPSNIKKLLSMIEGGHQVSNLSCQPDKVICNRIFIVGLPRCGSTLLESILSMNPDAIDLGEISAISNLIKEKRIDPKSNINKEDTTMSFDEHYQAYVKKTLPKNCFTIDKTLANFMHIPTLNHYLPKAKIIYSKRHPLDHILSMLKANLSRGNNYTSSVKDAALALIECEKTMNHLINKFPNYIHVNDYDKLVNNPEEEIKKVIDFIGWEWHENYLYPDKANRIVRTASVLQVRKPINNKSCGGWKKYSELLSPAIPILEQSSFFDDYCFAL